MKIQNKEVWIILFAAIILMLTFAFTVKAQKSLTGIIIMRDIPGTSEDFEYFVNEDFTTNFYLPDTDCSGFVFHCSYTYSSDVNPRSDLNVDGKINEKDIIAASAAYGCSNGQSCWNKPVEQCFFYSEGRKFRDPDRNCTMNLNDLNMISTFYNQQDPYALSDQCEFQNICKADINQDGYVDVQDSVIAAGFYGKTATVFDQLIARRQQADVNQDGVVNINDVVIIAGDYGKTAIKRTCTKVPINHVTGKEYSFRIQGKYIDWVQVAYDCPI